MQTDKPKRSPWYAHPLLYAVLWGLGVAGMGQIARMLIALIPVTALTPQQYDLVAVFVPTLLMAVVPIVLTERLLKHSMRNWLIYTLVGTLIGLLWFAAFPWDSKDPLILFFHSLSGIWPSLLQSLWLRGRVKWPWLWMIAHVVVWKVSGVLMPRGIFLSEHFLLMFWTFVQQVPLGLMMHTLWQNPRDTSKAKVDAAEDVQSDEERAQRLQEAERHDNHDLHEHGSTQALHNHI